MMRLGELEGGEFATSAAADSSAAAADHEPSCEVPKELTNKDEDLDLENTFAAAAGKFTARPNELESW